MCKGRASDVLGTCKERASDVQVTCEKVSTTKTFGSQICIYIYIMAIDRRRRLQALLILSSASCRVVRFRRCCFLLYEALEQPRLPPKPCINRAVASSLHLCMPVRRNKKLERCPFVAWVLVSAVVLALNLQERACNFLCSGLELASSTRFCRLRFCSKYLPGKQGIRSFVISVRANDVQVMRKWCTSDVQGTCK